MTSADNNAEIDFNSPDHIDHDFDGNAVDFLDDSNTTQPRHGVLQYNGASYAVGLVWLSISEDDD